MKDEGLFPATVMPDDDWWHALWPDPDGVLESIGMTSGMHVLDLCCGNGHFTRAICRRAQPGKVWGLDLDQELLDVTCEKCGNEDNFSPIHGDARDLPQHIDRPLDMIIIANTFHGVPDKQALVRSVLEVLETGGLFVIINWHRLPREQTQVLKQPRGPDFELRMSPEQTVDIVQSTGLAHQKTIDVGPFHYAAIFTRRNQSAG